MSRILLKFEFAIPGSSFFKKSSESENEEAAESEPQPLVEPLDEGGATRDDDRVTANFNIFKASFQWIPLISVQ